MARLFWLIVVLSFVGLLFTGASWAAAFATVGTYLGAPPPQMGSQTTSIEWPTMDAIKDHPPLWRFAFGPTVIPGAANVRIYVNPIGRIVATDPSDLDARLEAFRKPMY